MAGTFKNTFNAPPGELKWLVADEADRLLDLGFEQKISSIVSLIDQQRTDPDARRQTVLLSATMHQKLGTLAQLSLHNPMSIGFKCELVGGKLEVTDSGAGRGAAGSKAADPQEGGDKYEMPKQLRQLYVTTPCKMRLMTLLALIRWVAVLRIVSVLPCLPFVFHSLQPTYLCSCSQCLESHVHAVPLVLAWTKGVSHGASG